MNWSNETFPTATLPAVSPTTLIVLTAINKFAVVNRIEMTSALVIGTWIIDPVTISVLLPFAAPFGHVVILTVCILTLAVVTSKRTSGK